MTTTDWNETKSILFEIEQIFQKDDDIHDIQDIQKMLNEIQNERNILITDTRQIIKSNFKLILIEC